MDRLAQFTSFEERPPVSTLTVVFAFASPLLNYPEKANIRSNQVIQEMGMAYEDFWMDREMQVMILTAAGERHFPGAHHFQPPPCLSPAR